jgi:hypothetical protein
MQLVGDVKRQANRQIALAGSKVTSRDRQRIRERTVF